MKFAEFIIQPRPLGSAELELKAAIEADPRLVVTKLQVRRQYKTDPLFVRRRLRYYMTRTLLLVYEFICPCGEIQREVKSLPFNWRHPDTLSVLCAKLSANTYQHLKDEGLV
jgi:hypothetical protein